MIYLRQRRSKQKTKKKRNDEPKINTQKDEETKKRPDYYLIFLFIEYLNKVYL